MTKKILLVGPGAVGVYFVGRIAKTNPNCDVTVLARSEYEFVKEHGYKITSFNGSFNWKPKMIQDIKEYQDEADFIFITTKVLPQADVISLIKPVVTPKTVLVLIQNGLNIEKPIKAAFPNNRILSTVAYIGISRIGVGTIKHTGGGELSCGEYPPQKADELLEGLKVLFDNAKVKFNILDDIEQMRWQKLLWNLPFNSLSVICGGVDTQVLIQDEKIYALIWKIMREIQQVAKLCGHELPLAMLERNMQFTKEFPPYKTSMLIDYENGRKMEVEAIVGSVLQIAREKYITLSCIETIYATLSMINSKQS